MASVWRGDFQWCYEVEICVDGQTYSTGQVESDRSTLVPWPLGPLGSRSRCSWRVRVEGDDGWTDWSEPDVFEVGLLDSGDWVGHFIGLHDDETLLASGGGSDRLSMHDENLWWTVVPISGVSMPPPTECTSCFSMGRRIGDLELTPGFTSYHSHLEYQTYDITEYLEPGDHAVVAVVSDGWWRGAVGFTHQDFCFGKSLSLLTQIEMDRAKVR